MGGPYARLYLRFPSTVVVVRHRHFDSVLERVED